MLKGETLRQNIQNYIYGNKNNTKQQKSNAKQIINALYAYSLDASCVVNPSESMLGAAQWRKLHAV